MVSYNTNKLSRFHSIDLIRGFSLLSMIAYHFLYDLKYIFNVNISWFGTYPTYIWQQTICITFIFISGISFCFSKNNLKRGIVIFFLGILLSLVTYIIEPDQFIVFGILHFLGIACIITNLLYPLLTKLPPIIGFIVFLSLFIITKEINNGYIGLLDIHLVKLPKEIYGLPFFSLLGFPGNNFFSADYFSIFPWIFLYLSGFFTFKLIGDKAKQSYLFKIKLPFLNFLGRHSLVIYIIHQPICYILIYIYFKQIIGK